MIYHLTRTEWRSQPEDLVPLCKFQVIFKLLSLFISLDIVFAVNKHENICIAGLLIVGLPTLLPAHLSYNLVNTRFELALILTKVCQKFSLENEMFLHLLLKCYELLKIKSYIAKSTNTAQVLVYMRYVTG